MPDLPGYMFKFQNMLERFQQGCQGLLLAYTVAIRGLNQWRMRTAMNFASGKSLRLLVLRLLFASLPECLQRPLISRQVRCVFETAAFLFCLNVLALPFVK